MHNSPTKRAARLHAAARFSFPKTALTNKSLKKKRVSFPKDPIQIGAEHHARHTL